MEITCFVSRSPLKWKRLVLFAHNVKKNYNLEKHEFTWYLWIDIQFFDKTASLLFSIIEIIFLFCLNYPEISLSIYQYVFDLFKCFTVQCISLTHSTVSHGKSFHHLANQIDDPKGNNFSVCITYQYIRNWIQSN